MQKPGLNFTGWGREIPVGGAIASLQVDATWKGVFCVRRFLQDGGGLIPGLFLQVSPQNHQPRTVFKHF